MGPLAIFRIQRNLMETFFVGCVLAKLIAKGLKNLHQSLWLHILRYAGRPIRRGTILSLDYVPTLGLVTTGVRDAVVRGILITRFFPVRVSKARESPFEFFLDRARHRSSRSASEPLPPRQVRGDRITESPREILGKNRVTNDRVNGSEPVRRTRPQLTKNQRYRTLTQINDFQIGGVRQFLFEDRRIQRFLTPNSCELPKALAYAPCTCQCCCPVTGRVDGGPRKTKRTIR